jgi:hypothetical protein
LEGVESWAKRHGVLILLTERNAKAHIKNKMRIVAEYVPGTG